MKQLRLLIFTLLAIFIYWIGITLFKAGVFRSVDNFSSNFQIKTIDTPPGIEDLDYDAETGTIFLSSHDRRNPDSNGAIYRIHTENKTPINLTDHLNLSEFRPHGISFFNSGQNKFLFVISHKNEKDVVLKFKFKNDSLKLEESYSSSDFSSPNDIFATGENSFFISNDHGKAKGLFKTLSDFLRIPVGNVVHFNDGRSTIVLDKISYPNGILVKDDHVYIASTINNYIGKYKPVSQYFHLEEVRKIKTPFPPDNLMQWGEKIFVGAHPKLLKFTSHAKSKDKLSPSAVYFYDDTGIHIIFTDDGSILSGSSTALPLLDHEGQLQIYVGSVFESKILKLSGI